VRLRLRSGQLTVGAQTGLRLSSHSTSDANRQQAAHAGRRQADGAASRSPRPSTTTPAAASPATTLHGTRSRRPASSSQAVDHSTPWQAKPGREASGQRSIRPGDTGFRHPAGRGRRSALDPMRTMAPPPAAIMWPRLARNNEVCFRRSTWWKCGCTPLLRDQISAMISARLAWYSSSVSRPSSCMRVTSASRSAADFGAAEDCGFPADRAAAAASALNFTTSRCAARIAMFPSSLCSRTMPSVNTTNATALLFLNTPGSSATGPMSVPSATPDVRPARIICAFVASAISAWAPFSSPRRFPPVNVPV